MHIEFRHLRTIKAIHECGGLARAADQLNITQSALSHQVKGLEEYLGVKLFRRLNRALRLTDEGQGYLPPVNKAFDLLHEATKTLLRRDATGPLTVSALPSFAARWPDLSAPSMPGATSSVCSPSRGARRLRAQRLFSNRYGAPG